MLPTKAGVPPRRHACFFLLVTLALVSLGVRCGPQDQPHNSPQATPTEISRDRAIDIARQEARVTAADSVEAVQATSEGRSVWRVTFKRRQPDAPPGLFETHIIEIDVRTGKIVSVSIS